MAVAAPKRRTGPAPPPSRTAPPKRKAPQRKAAAPATAPARKRAPARRASAATAPAPARVPARKPARKAPQRARPKVRRSPGARVIPFAGRTAVAVSQLPDSGLIVRMTRGRLWIGVLGVLLVGIVALNVVNLSFSANAAKIDGQIAALEQENNVLEGRDATKSSVDRVHSLGRAAGLYQPSAGDIHFTEFNRDSIPNAVQRLAAISP